MPRTSDKRERLVEAAKVLIHQQGFNQTTLADIAEESKVPLGNVYYYFKTKEDIATAVLDQRITTLRKMLNELEESNPDPRERLKCMLAVISRSSDKMAAYGCPIGSLCQELDKHEGTLTEKADAILKVHLEWITRQFKQLGLPDAEALGVEFAAGLHGTTLMGHAMNDPKLICGQVKRLENWLDTL